MVLNPKSGPRPQANHLSQSCVCESLTHQSCSPQRTGQGQVSSFSQVIQVSAQLFAASVWEGHSSDGHPGARVREGTLSSDGYPRARGEGKDSLLAALLSSLCSYFHMLPLHMCTHITDLLYGEAHPECFCSWVFTENERIWYLTLKFLCYRCVLSSINVALRSGKTVKIPLPGFIFSFVSQFS